jgi:hypothetical protein
VVGTVRNICSLSNMRHKQLQENDMLHRASLMGSAILLMPFKRFE